MGVYRCVADNNIKPPAEHLAEVFVFHAPKTRVVQDSVGQAQNRRFWAKLECIVQGQLITSNRKLCSLSLTNDRINCLFIGILIAMARVNV